MINNTPTYQNGFYAMGTLMQCVIPGVRTDFGDHLLYLVNTRIQQLEKALSIYRQDSAVSELNHALKNSTVAEVLDEDLAWALKLSAKGYKHTKQLYNPAAGKMIAQVKNQQQSTLQDSQFELSREYEIRTSTKGLQFDFGGLAKGMALDEAKQILKSQACDCALLSFGDSSIYGLGQHPHGDYWPIAIPNPLKDSETIANVNLSDSGLSLSSTIANGRNQGKLHKHIINPQTGALINTPLTSYVVSESMSWGEILSTASLVLGEQIAVSELPEEAGVNLVQVVNHQQRGNEFESH